ncbi:MAG: coniferyl-aldehyde dehydrogenase [Myxococcota bacterium]
MTAAASIPKKKRTKKSEVDAVQTAFDTLKAGYKRDGALDYAARMDAVARIGSLTKKYLPKLEAAARADFGNRSAHETALYEVFPVLNTVQYIRKHLKSWMAPQKRHAELIFKPAKNEVRFQALGVVGIIAPWNYPFSLSAVPLAYALAAGNRVALKPSEFTPNVSQTLAEMLSEGFAPEMVQVVTGGPDVGKAFSSQPFDHLLYTGSTAVGRHIMRAAAENLTPVTLELGGKSPAIIHPDYPIAKAATTIAAGKLVNAGQTCVATDYVLCPEGKVAEFVDAYRAAAEKFYPTIRDNDDYTSIITDRHFERISKLRDDAAAEGANVITINPANEELPAADRKIAPTVLIDVKDSMEIMQDEIFGPLLPVMSYRVLDEAIDYVNDHPRPLALYYFDDDKRRVDHVLEATVSGGVCVNETVLHVGQDDLPFGGVGASGMGAYHGREGFETFSHKKAVFRSGAFSVAGLTRPPYGTVADGLLRVVAGRKKN